MQDKFKSEHWTKDGVPMGGVTSGTGLCISWQNGGLGREPDRKEPNGAFVETVMAAAVDRLEYYQSSKFNCLENAHAINCLNEALNILGKRTQRREQEGSEGTHKI